ncbi:MAG: gamma-glutamyl-gamma-aminobutyrate hydrolase family protein [Solirubrobacterales bacterium]|nr:gamma-glutamyl-gamma-aminobutyrate hydrolase family protein [Solirubrobacterales bacterium]
MSAADGPVIGVCAVRERARWAFWDQEADLVADSYVAPLQRAGGLAVLLAVDTRAPLELLDRIDGLMLIGGADIDPEVYGAAREAAIESTYPDRDRFEIALLRGALERELPVLGICRGMQILNVALGGTLIQDLVAADGTHPHRKFKGTFAGNAHTVALVSGSLAERAVGERAHVAHCHHHQAVLTLGDGLVVSGRAEDGVIEAIEMVDGRWGLGVQWHPEADDRSRLFGALCEAARDYATGATGTAAVAGHDGQRIWKPFRPSGSSSRTSTLSTSA